MLKEKRILFAFLKKLKNINILQKPLWFFVENFISQYFFMLLDIKFLC